MKYSGVTFHNRFHCGQGDGAALAALVESLSVDVFADMVIAILERLPPREYIADDTPANGDGGGLASMLQVCEP